MCLHILPLPLPFPLPPPPLFFPLLILLWLLLHLLWSMFTWVLVSPGLNYISVSGAARELSQYVSKPGQRDVNKSSARIKINVINDWPVRKTLKSNNVDKLLICCGIDSDTIDSEWWDSVLAVYSKGGKATSFFFPPLCLLNNSSAALAQLQSCVEAWRDQWSVVEDRSLTCTLHRVACFKSHNCLFVRLTNSFTTSRPNRN